MSTSFPPPASGEVIFGREEPSLPRQPTPNEEPSEHETAQPEPPTQPIKYSFSPCSLNSMVLNPPPGAQDTRPQYHITVSVNCFMPLSHITTVRRGATEFGELVGDFEMGIIERADSIYIRGNEHFLSHLLIKQGSHKTATWRWSLVPNRNPQQAFLLWDTAAYPHICRLVAPEATILAKFYSTTALRRHNQPVHLAQLEVFPAGRQHFDDVLISLLVVERKRLTPSSGDFKYLFSR